MRYPVKLTKDNGAFVATFPDVPEAITYGDTKEEALERAADALLTIFDAFMKDRRDIPLPSARPGPFVEVPPLENLKLQLYRSMRAMRIGKSDLAKRLDWHLPQVDRLFAIRHGSKLEQLNAAFHALGKQLTIDVVDITPTRQAKRQPAGRSAGRAHTHAATDRRRRA